MAAEFLDLPARSEKPRAAGLTHALDKGLPLRATEAVLATAAAYVDIWKFGWGTAYLDPALPEKLAVLREHEIRACLGGTLLEAAWLQDRAKQCLDWAAEQGFAMVEVSRGVAPMTLADKTELIRHAVDRFVVVSEVGSKDPAAAADPDLWREEACSDVDAGAWKVVAEGRESGTVGLYHPSGSVRAELVVAISDALGADTILFEAPRKDQQAWFVRQFGADVNLANIATDDLVGVEALRLGLRADTIKLPPGAG